MQWRSWLPCHPWNSLRRSTTWRFRCFTIAAHRPICSSSSSEVLFFMETTQIQIKTNSKLRSKNLKHKQKSQVYYQANLFLEHDRRRRLIFLLYIALFYQLLNVICLLTKNVLKRSGEDWIVWPSGNINSFTRTQNKSSFMQLIHFS